MDNLGCCSSFVEIREVLKMDDLVLFTSNAEMHFVQSIDDLIHSSSITEICEVPESGRFKISQFICRNELSPRKWTI